MHAVQNANDCSAVISSKYICLKFTYKRAFGWVDCSFTLEYTCKCRPYCYSPWPAMRVPHVTDSYGQHHTIHGTPGGLKLMLKINSALWFMMPLKLICMASMQCTKFMFIHTTVPCYTCLFLVYNEKSTKTWLAYSVKLYIHAHYAHALK